MVKAAAIIAALFSTMTYAAVIDRNPANPGHSVTEKRDYSGSGTYYQVGLGACGWNSTPDQPVVAISAALYDSNGGGYCGRQIWIWSNTGKPAQLATVVDRCTGCAYYDLDMSTSLFQNAVGDLSIGRAPIGWNWA